MKTENFTINGKLGDFLHMMFAAKHICKKNQTKANIYLYHFGWEHGFERAFYELQDLVLSQSFVNSFQMLKDYKMLNNHSSGPIEVFDPNLLKEGYTHLEDFMRSPDLYHYCWSEIFSRKFNFSINEEYKWIEFNKTNPDFEGKVIINRRHNPSRLNPDFPYEEFLSNYKNNIIFIASEYKDYENFPYKHLCDYHEIKTIDEWFTIINSSGLYIGNLSGPTSIASSLDKIRIVELPHTADIYHWMGEEKYSKNIGWFVNNNLNYINFN